ncbi:hypothetical protein TEA_006390 [Camellia sinensis var. sinensis]|uniref:Uncharacterized protein n=1 Tax=Camellia sinensis var. sinensis TaxID=542762 RepID=A0A4S4E311_CAMSN|nr:hypothetical protein TEA_006390 [Camellia sinensis var. sinensis]
MQKCGDDKLAGFVKLVFQDGFIILITAEFKALLRRLSRLYWVNYKVVASGSVHMELVYFGYGWGGMGWGGVVHVFETDVKLFPPPLELRVNPILSSQNTTLVVLFNNKDYTISGIRPQCKATRPSLLEKYHAMALDFSIYHDVSSSVFGLDHIFATSSAFSDAPTMVTQLRRSASEEEEVLSAIRAKVRRG